MYQALTGTPTVLADLEEGRLYTIQNKSGFLMYLEPGSRVPERDSRAAFEIQPGEGGTVKRSDEEDIYVWSAVTGLDQGHVAYARVP